MPFLAITATASLQARRKICRRLGLVKPIEIVQNPDRGNIKLYKKKVSSSSSIEDMFSWILPFKPTMQRTIIFSKTIRECSSVYSALKRSLSPPEYHLIDMFHSCSTDATKERIRDDMGKRMVESWFSVLQTLRVWA